MHLSTDQRIRNLEDKVASQGRDIVMLSICVVILAVGFVAFTFFI